VAPDGPIYSRNKPKREEVQKHFQKFLKNNGDKPKPNMFVAEPDMLNDLVAKADNLTAQELAEEITKVGAEGGVPVNPTDVPEMQELVKDFSLTLNSSIAPHITNYQDITEGMVARSVDLTPQLNYTDSSAPTFSNISFNSSMTQQDAAQNVFLANTTNVATNFVPTQKEIESINKISSFTDKPRVKRGRKPSKITGNE